MTHEMLISAPVYLGADTRGAFRDAGVAALESIDAAGGRLVIDLSTTQRIDSAGLGVLMQLQARAAERRHGVVLRGASEEIRFLLLMTRLEDRFVIEP